jgi:hypothetical protein
MAGESKTTTDHDEIRRWADEHGGRPAHVADTADGDDPGILRIEFDPSDDNLEEISWDEFFEWFDRNELALVYQDEKASGEPSTFSKLVSRNDVNA